MSVHIQNPGLRRAYSTLQASGPRGRELAAILEQRSTRVYVVRQISGGFTLNFLNMIFLQPLSADASERDYRMWVCLLAHEACHIEQKFWVDSIQQEMRAYAAQVHVSDEVGVDLDLIQRFRDLDAALVPHQEIARAALQQLFAGTPASLVYASLPLMQPMGTRALAPALRQMLTLVRAAFYRPRRPPDH